MAGPGSTYVRRSGHGVSAPDNRKALAGTAQGVGNVACGKYGRTFLYDGEGYSRRRPLGVRAGDRVAQRPGPLSLRGFSAETVMEKAPKPRVACSDRFLGPWPPNPDQVSKNPVKCEP